MTEKEFQAFLDIIKERFNATVIPDKPKLPWEEPDEPKFPWEE